ncbi:hypothetical protein [Melittangium boletus]|uniref:Uncharacterized protein n=1 Tax=Melittangium boletus DSM 14713 TaxID=1294270 RepID=A0A250IMJ8_9BACT|nr:hypothetical protein [Melittangium boletus]ATB32964.1 hypothetical protein MEBOL_006453 [Melittangium boletus DSM 14713]
MAARPPIYERQVDQDGVVRIQKKRTGGGLWLVWLALGFTALCVALGLWLESPSDSESPPPERVPARVVERAPAPPSVHPAPRTMPPPPVPAQPQAVVEDAVAQGPAEGLDLYRPGTKPLKQGIIVPEDFELPPGYVRHYQATDEGERVQPILMFHPDYQPLDADGQPMELPANRVVPPELAPPGMPLDILELPSGPEGVEPIP